MILTDKHKEYIKCAKDPAYFLNNYGFVFDAQKQSMAQMKCFEYQEDCLKKFHKYRNNIVLKSRQCLPKGTLVDTPNGKIKIENLKQDNEVYSYNFETNTVEIDNVFNSWRSGQRQCVKIYLKNSLQIEVGENHPFYVVNKGWVAAKSLKESDIILDKEKKSNSVVENVVKTKVKDCYDISVKRNENYFISGLLTHNTGLSVITAGYVAWRLIFRKDERVLIIANDGKGAVRFLSTVKQFIDYTPLWLMPKNGIRLKNNQKEIQLGNNSYASAQASSPDAGRGDSLTLLVLDETAFIDYAEQIWMAAGIALSQTQGKAILISTPSGTGNLYHSVWTEAMKKETGFSADDFIPTKVHWTQNPFASEGMEERIDDKGEKFYWSPWYESECKRMQFDKVKIAQELDLSFEGSKYLAIDNELINKYEKRMLLEEYQNIEKNKIYYDYRNEIGKRFVDYETNFWVFKPYLKGHKYILGSDISRGDSKDYSTIQIMDIDTLEVVAEYRDRIPPDMLAIVIYNVAMDYGEAYVVVEANSFGLGTGLDLNKKMGYTRMYFSKNYKDLYVASYNYTINVNEIVPGFQTSKVTRPLVIYNLRSHLREGGIKIYSKRLMSEFKTFIQNGDRAEAEPGKNDDLIFALAICLYIRDTEYKNAANTKEMYKAMIDAIGYNNTNINGQTAGTNKEEVAVVGNKETAFINKEGLSNADKKTDMGGIFYSTGNDNKDNDIDDPNDISWLLG